jgi:ELWxxDGT repeat protein
MRALRLLLLSLVLLGAAPASFTPYLVKDIDPYPSPASSNPTSFTALGRLALFQVNGWSVDTDRQGLWRSDGTAFGTYRLMAAEYVQSLVAAGDRCFFGFLADGDRWYLGVTDGTLPGTFTLTEVKPWWGSSGAWVPRQRVYYFPLPADSPEVHATKLWRSDGTPGGTYEVADIAAVPGASDLRELTSFQGRLYFAAGSALWTSDGTAAGTVKVRDVPAASLRVVGSSLVFVGTDSQGSELWASDGTAAGTRRIADLTPGAGSTTFNAFKAVGKRLFFSATTSARGDELYVTDGTAQGTRRLTWFTDPGALAFDSWRPAPMEALGDRLLFTASDPEHGSELWSSDGTPKGTRLLMDACPGECSSNPDTFLQHRGRLYYRAGGGIWITDGTAAGTHQVKDLCCGYGADNWRWIADPSGDRVFLAISDAEFGIETSLWTTDGTAEGTMMLRDFWDEDLSLDGTVAGGALLFSGDDDFGDVELWRSDGTLAGTHLLVDIENEDLGGSSPHGLMTLGQSALFFAHDDQGYALWRSDGTEVGTTVVKRGLGGRTTAWTGTATRVFFVPTRSRESLWTSDGTEAGTVRLTPAGVRCQGPISAPVTRLGSRVFFSAWFPPSGTEPWVTDGTPQGTRLLADLTPGRDGSSPSDLTVFAGKVWFTALRHLWKSDGTAQGTVAAGPELQDLHPRTTYGGRLWFTGLNGAGRTELWATDGTAARTERIAVRKTVGSLTVHAGRLWFLINGRELWSTDGTAAGTRKLVDLPGSAFRSLLSDGARLYLADSSSALWVSDGTAAGTRKISDVGLQAGSWIAFAGRLYYASSEGSFHTSDGTAAGTRPVRPDGEPRGAASLFRLGDRLVAVNDHRELWLSDGTAEGTKRLTRPAEYRVGEIVKAGPRLFFAGWDVATGTELWALHE